MPSAKTKVSKRRYEEDSDDSEEIIQPPPKKVGTLDFVLRLQIITDVYVHILGKGP